MARLREIVFDALNPSALARFWAAALDGYAVRPYGAAEVERIAALGLTPESDPAVAVDGSGPTLWFQRATEPKTERNRVHLDAEAPDRRAEVTRLLALGASLAREGADYTVLRDPEGNELCIADPRPGAATLADLLRELVEHEAIFHRPARSLSRSDLARRIDPSFVEIGASGRLYDREQVLDVLERRRDEPDGAAFEARDHRCVPISFDTYLLAYTIEGARRTRRASIWRRQSGTWTILFHQGTIV
jgi:hypothetical protein